jgi:hypothetical protein
MHESTRCVAPIDEGCCISGRFVLDVDYSVYFRGLYVALEYAQIGWLAVRLCKRKVVTTLPWTSLWGVRGMPDISVKITWNSSLGHVYIFRASQGTGDKSRDGKRGV